MRRKEIKIWERERERERGMIAFTKWISLLATRPNLLIP